MKLRTFSQLLLFAFAIMCIAPSCVKEGPEGKPGKDGVNGDNGIDGADGSLTCLACHGGDNMLKKQSQFVLSGHAIGTWTMDHNPWSASCVRCHTPVGFKEFALGGDAAITGQIENTDKFECSTCHGLHSTFAATDYALRMSAPVNPVVTANGVMDLKGNSNLCGNCHQARTPEPNKEKPGTTYKLSVRTGPHHGPEANLLYGVGLAEIAGSVAYPAKGTGDHLNKPGGSCIGCHMYTYNNAKATGGHTWNPSVDACNKCHDGADIADYNYKGVQSDTEAKLEQLRDKLLELGALVKTDTDEFALDAATGEIKKVGTTTAYVPANGKTVPMVQAQAVYNYFGIEEDRSLGVHNPVYVRALLVNTMEALNK